MPLWIWQESVAIVRQNPFSGRYFALHCLIGQFRSLLGKAHIWFRMGSFVLVVTRTCILRLPLHGPRASVVILPRFLQPRGAGVSPALTSSFPFPLPHIPFFHFPFFPMLLVPAPPG